MGPEQYQPLKGLSTRPLTASETCVPYVTHDAQLRGCLESVNRCLSMADAMNGHVSHNVPPRENYDLPDSLQDMGHRIASELAALENALETLRSSLGTPYQERNR